MEFDEIIRARRSIRRYKDEDIPVEISAQLIEAARLAPSATNRQPWRFMFIRDKDVINILQEVVVQPFIVSAPLIIMCCIDRNSFTRQYIKKQIDELVSVNVVNSEVAGELYKRRMPEKLEEAGIPASAYIDLGIAIEHIVLKAHELGLGSCWVRMFDHNRLTEMLKLPEGIAPVVLLPVGYPDEKPPPRPRLPAEKITLKSVSVADFY